MALSVKPSFNFPHFASVALVVMVISHLIGIVGLNSNRYNELFESIASINLLLSFILVIVFHTPVNRNLFLFCIFSFILGMGAEITGVNTGYPFGLYHYTPSFGRRVAGVPYIIGINWILLSYVAGVVVNGRLIGEWQKIAGASFLMVAIDLLLEGFATRHHLWTWQADAPPFQNYVSWFIISAIIQVAFRRLIPFSVNPNAAAYLIILLLFLFADLLIYIIH